jgi:hypothetical protein
MEQALYTAARSKGARIAPANGTELLRLLVLRLKDYQALAESLANCHLAYAGCDLEGIMYGVEVQSSLCQQITHLESQLRTLQTSGKGLGDDAPQSRIEELQRLTVEVKKQVSILNRTHASLVRKAAHNNAVLRHLYANALVYADPRTDSADGLTLAKEEHYG